MSVSLRGKSYHYRFMVAGKSYSGVCVGCVSQKQAEAFEARERETLKETAVDIKRNRTVRALVENYAYTLTGGKPIVLAEAHDLAAAKPSRRKIRSAYGDQRRGYWRDFCAFMSSTYPDVKHLTDVRRTHCEAYVKYLVDNGRFDKWVVDPRTGKSYLRDYLLSGKTIGEIAGACQWVFSRLEEDAGLYRNPWTNVVLPAEDPVDREVFTLDELLRIWDGLQTEPFCRVLFTVAANSGLTEGDICTLKWDDIDWIGEHLRRDRRKTGTEIDLPLLPELANYLREQPHRGEYIFPEHAELYLREPSCVSDRVIRFLQGLGIVTTVKLPGRRAVSVKDLHSMRHVFCYRAKRAGIPESIIAKFVGHKVLAMTQHYADHDTAAELREEIKKLPPLFVGEAGGVIDAGTTSRRRLAELAYSLPLEQVETLLAALQAPERKPVALLA